MLPSVRNRFISAYEEAGKPIPTNAFVRVWNLFYLCNKNLEEACAKINHFTTPPRCPSENDTPPVVWFAWGGDDARLNHFKERFASPQYPSFYYNHTAKEIMGNAPTFDDFAKHPQGLPAKPVVDYLSMVLQKHP